jgi:Tfp pilus assembly protein PilZ
MSASKKDQNIKKYNVTISKLIKLILDLNEEHQEALLKKGQELLLKEKRAPRKSCRIPVRYTTFDRVYSDRIMNISQSGVFIETRRPIFVGEEILMDFQIEGVNSSRGVGIEFKNVDPTLSQIMPAIFDLMKG